MAGSRKAAEPDFEPKHRIVGAAILIGLAVLVFSLLLDGDGPGREVPLAAQAEGDLPVPTEYVSSEEETRTFVSKITPIGGATPAAPAESEPAPAEPIRPVNRDSTPVAAADSGMSQPAEAPAAPPAPPPVPAPEPQASAGINPGDPGLERGWMVRVGTFTDQSNVDRVLADLREKGFSPSTTPTKTASGSATRVWLGPYAQRVEAARVRSSLEQSTGEPGLITAYP